MSLRLVMMGTGRFALPTFLGLCESSHDVVGLVTQPDRTGRGHHRHAHPMKDTAVERRLPVFQPDNANSPESLDRLRQFEADLFVVAAYGQILSADLLAIPRLGAINVHASLLPKYRGAAPINYAILNGEAETGITLFQIEPRLDAGPMLGQVSTPIGGKETAGDVEQRLSQLAVELTLDVVDQIEAGTAQGLPQDRSLVSKAPRMPKQLGAIDWTQPAVVVERHLRAMQPWPKPYTYLHQPDRDPLRLLILDADPTESPEKSSSSPAGTILAVDVADLIVQCGEDALAVRRLQPAGKRAMATADFLRGHAVTVGDRLGPES